jgi:NTP pyrophosphatase (non-canonical NTP hydrolase)
MGPADSSTMSTADALKLIKLPKLKDDGSNWITYRERIINTLTHKGLKRHVLGTARVPDEIEIRSSKSYKKGGIIELTEEQLDAIEKYTDEYEQREASVREVIYETISQSLFLQIKNEPTSARVWTKLISIMEKKGNLTQVSTLTKMQTMICLEDDDVRAHLASMTELKEQLDGMGAPVSDQSFAAMIRKLLPTSYRSLLQTLSATARVNNKILTSDQIIAAIHEEADELKVHKEADKAAKNAAMVATQAKR